MNTHEHLSFLEAAEYCNTSRSKVWRATKQGELLSEQRQKNGRDVWTVRLEDLVQWAKREGLEVQPEQSNSSEHTASSHEHSRTVEGEHLSEQSTKLQEMLLERFEQIQRRAIYLEMQLQQSQRLLCERNEDQYEREARALEAEAKAQMAQEEADRFKIELESLKIEMASKEIQWLEQRKPWYKKIFRKSG